jgi:hypothetical protein
MVPSGRTILQYIVEECPEVHYFTQSGTRHQRVAFTSDPMDLTGPKMIQKLNMIFFLKRDIARVFDLKKAAERKKQRDNAAAVIGGAILRLTQVRDIKWALPWYFLCFLCFRLLPLLPLLPLAASASSASACCISASACCLCFLCFRLLHLLHLCFRLLHLTAAGRSTMTQQKQTTIWERMISTRHYRANNPIQYAYAEGWTPLTALEMQFAAGY